MHKLPTNLEELILITVYITNTEFVKEYPNLTRLYLSGWHDRFLESVSNLEYLQKLEHLTIDTMADVMITEASRDFIKNRRFISLELPTIAGVLPTSEEPQSLHYLMTKATDLSWYRWISNPVT